MYSKTEQAEMLRAGRLQALGGTVQNSSGLRRGVELDESVIVLLQETITEMVFSLPSFITASDMREVSKCEGQINLKIFWSVHMIYRNSCWVQMVIRTRNGLNWYSYEHGFKSTAIYPLCSCEPLGGSSGREEPTLRSTGTVTQSCRWRLPITANTNHTQPSEKSEWYGSS